MSRPFASPNWVNASCIAPASFSESSTPNTVTVPPLPGGGTDGSAAVVPGAAVVAGAVEPGAAVVAGASVMHPLPPAPVVPVVPPVVVPVVPPAVVPVVPPAVVPGAALVPGAAVVAPPA